MSWPTDPPTRTNPAFYTDAESATEAQLRADFTHYYQLRLIAAYAESSPAKASMHQHANSLAAKWSSHEQRTWRSLWRQLQGAVAGWEARPHTTARVFDRLAQSRELGGLPIEDMTWRTLVQARDITGRGPEPITGSEQDAARTPAREPHLQLVAATDTAPQSVLDRAFGADFHTPVTDASGDQPPDGPATTEEAPALAPHARAFADDIAAQQDQQIDALRRLQNATAEHALLTNTWEPETLHGERILRLEHLLTEARNARREAARAGLPVHEITQTYQTGLTGVYWHERAGHPLLGRIDHLVHERDHAIGAAAHVPTFSGPDAADGSAGSDIDSAIAAAVAAHGVDPADWETEADNVEVAQAAADHSVELS